MLLKMQNDLVCTGQNNGKRRRRKKDAAAAGIQKGL